jgi:uncharacterized Tic20 family protein
MSQSSLDAPDTTMAGAAHLTAMTGPVIPFFIWLARRRDDAFATEEAAKAVNFSLLAVALFVLATLIRIFVPLLGFLGTLAQWVVPIVAAYFCIQAFRVARRGAPASYPYQFKVVKTND